MEGLASLGGLSQKLWKLSCAHVHWEGFRNSRKLNENCEKKKRPGKEEGIHSTEKGLADGVAGGSRGIFKDISFFGPLKKGEEGWNRKIYLEHTWGEIGVYVPRKNPLGTF